MRHGPQPEVKFALDVADLLASWGLESFEPPDEPMDTQHFNETQNLFLYLNAKQRGALIKTLETICGKVTPALGMNKALVRANVFGIAADGKVRMLPGAVANMWQPLELSLSRWRLAR